MAMVVPFDGSELSKTALVRAVQFDTVLDEGISVVSVIPRNNANYAEKKEWIESTEQFDLETISAHLREQVTDIAPEAEFHPLTVDRWARSGTISSKIRRFARDYQASIVFVGSENAGRIVNSISVGTAVAGDRAYDTMIVSHEGPTQITELEEKVPTEDILS
jgi:nucleotide-binding universal stress UspA family protein